MYERTEVDENSLRMTLVAALSWFYLWIRWRNEWKAGPKRVEDAAGTQATSTGHCSWSWWCFAICQCRRFLTTHYSFNEEQSGRDISPFCRNLSIRQERQSPARVLLQQCQEDCVLLRGSIRMRISISSTDLLSLAFKRNEANCQAILSMSKASRTQKRRIILLPTRSQILMARTQETTSIAKVQSWWTIMLPVQ